MSTRLRQMKTKGSFVQKLSHKPHIMREGRLYVHLIKLKVFPHLCYKAIT